MRSKRSIDVMRFAIIFIPLLVAAAPMVTFAQLATSAPSATAAPIVTTPPAADAANIALSATIAQRVGDRIWPDWSKTKFAIDLLTAGGPVEVNFDKPVPVPSFPPQMEASFPFSNGVPTIVIGEPQFTQAKTPIRWSVTLLHEHFHQWQYSWPQYNSSVKNLGLAPPGDTNAMWMLNYPFPYSDAAIGTAYSVMTHRLAEAIRGIGTPEFGAQFQSYLVGRKQFAAMLKPNDYKYFAFQCWQEGTARYTEIAVARAAVDEHTRDQSFLSDDQAAALALDAQHTYSRVLGQLEEQGPLANDERSNFYAVGAAEALLLDRVSPGWHQRYLGPRMDLSALFPASS